MTERDADYVALARDHWTPRFVAHGVPFGEAQRVFERIPTWDHWCAAWSELGGEYEARAATALSRNRCVTAGEWYSIAAACYHFAKFAFVQDLVQLRAAHDLAVACASQALALPPYAGRRVEVPWEGAHLPGNLRLPAGTGPHPVVVLVSGVDSTKEEMRATEPYFLDRGLATFSFDGPGQGEAEYDIPLRPDYEGAGSAVIDTLQDNPEIDAGRIGLWGVSLGGYYVARIASADSRVTACVAVSGPFDVGALWPRTPPLTRDIFRVRSHTQDERTLDQLLAQMTLEGRTANITCPTLVVAGRQDRLVPWEEQQRLAQQIAASELRVYDEGNHVCANLASTYRPDAADWLVDALS